MWAERRVDSMRETEFLFEENDKFRLYSFCVGVIRLHLDNREEYSQLTKSWILVVLSGLTENSAMNRYWEGY